MRGARWLGLIVMLIASCSDDPVAPPSLAEPVAPNEVRAGRIRVDAERIRGPNAKSRIGDYKIYNERIAVAISDVDSALGFHPFGGGVIDADVVHSAPGKSAFGEVIWSLDFRVMRTTGIEVVDAGAVGRAARLRVKGTLGRLPLFDAILGDLLPEPSLEAEWTIDYVLEPNASALRIEHELFNSGRTQEEVSPLVGFFFGVAARPFFERLGFSSSNSGAASPYYAAVGEGVSYLVAQDGADVSAIFGESGIMVANVGEVIRLRARERKRFVAHLYVGTDDLAATRAAWLHDRSITTRRIEGEVVDEAGVPIARAHVHVVEGTPDNPSQDYVTRTVTDDDGNFGIDVDLTDVRLVATTADGLVSAPVEATPTARLVVPSVGRIVVEVNDSAGGPLPSKLSLSRSSARLDRAPRRYGEPEQGVGFDRVIFLERGRAEVLVPPGEWLAVVSRGIEYEVETSSVTVVAETPASLSVTLVRSVDTPGWMTSDPHVHAERSSDSPDSFELKTRALVAENIELPVSTDHEAIGDFEPAIAALGVGKFIRGIVGTEISTTRYGHFNAYPVQVDDTLPGHGRINWYGLTPGGFFAAAHALEPSPVVQVNHPRSTSIGYFELLGFDRDTLTATSDDLSLAFDGIEVINTCGDGALDRPEVLDWFAFLSRGEKKFATGTMDDHTARRGELGVPLTYVQVEGVGPRDVTPQTFRDAVRGGHLVVTCGPFISASIGGAGVGDTAAVDGRIDADVTVSAAGWVDVDEVLLIVDGVVRDRASVAEGPGGVRFSGT